MTIRKNVLALVATVAIGAAAIAQAGDARVFSNEHGIETSTDALLMPTSASGAVTLTCETCAARSFQLNDQTTFQIGERSVTLQEFTAFAKTNKLNATLFVKAGDLVVTRIRASAPATTTVRK